MSLKNPRMYSASCLVGYKCTDNVLQHLLSGLFLFPLCFSRKISFFCEQALSFQPISLASPVKSASFTIFAPSFSVVSRCNGLSSIPIPDLITVAKVKKYTTREIRALLEEKETWCWGGKTKTKTKNMSTTMDKIRWVIQDKVHSGDLNLVRWGWFWPLTGPMLGLFPIPWYLWSHGW